MVHHVAKVVILAMNLVAGVPMLPRQLRQRQWVERVFTESGWDVLTQMAAPEYTYERILRPI